MTQTKSLDSTVARIAGNLLSGAAFGAIWVGRSESWPDYEQKLAEKAVRMARLIVAEVACTGFEDPSV